MPPDPKLIFSKEVRQVLQVQRHIWHTIRKMIRDPRHGLSVIILHTIMKNRRIHPHEMSEHHGGGSSK
jgi:hypothetical protein